MCVHTSITHMYVYMYLHTCACALPHSSTHCNILLFTFKKIKRSKSQTLGSLPVLEGIIHE